MLYQMGCCWGELWMDTSRGVFCRGPRGPWWEGSRLELNNLPLDAEIIKEDVLARYLASRKLDREVVEWLSWDYDRRDVSQVKVDRPTVISTLDDTILAIRNGVWNDSWDCLGERTELPNGTTRRALRNCEFTLKCNQRYLALELEFDWEEARRDWLAQALSVFHTHGIPLEGDMSTYKLVLPRLLKGTISLSKAKRRRRRKYSPIYLFVLPLSASTFWSFNQDGQTPIPADLCRYLGLPPSLSLTCWEHSCPTSTYKTLQVYQVARNLDPTTTDFAQHRRNHIYEVVKTSLSSRFEEIDNLATTEDSPSPKTFTRSPSGACTLDDGCQAPDIEDMSLRLLLGDTPLEGSSADSGRRTSSRLLQKGSPSKPLATPLVSQAARRTVLGLKPSSKPIASRPVRTPAKPMTVPKPREVATRAVVSPSRKTPLSNVREGTKVVPPVMRGTTPCNPPCSGGSTLRGTEASTRRTVNTVSRTLPAKPMSKPVSAETETLPKVSGSTPPSTSSIKTTLPRSSGIHLSRPDRTINSTERATTPKSGAPSAPLPTPSRKTGTATTTKRTIPHPTTSRSNGAATVPQRPPPTPHPSTLRTPRPGASSSGVTTQADTVQEQQGVQERIETTRIKEASSSNPPSRSPVVATSRVTRPLATRPSVRRS
ncbi:hypothetical protein V5O48_017758 [Marasmius crinis-equi]|uniref:Uncharacterized protein n=1 Tax=Marasmius crinis-equi TaxID=585013 RepID=A0ABR3EN43_9AGAR